MDLVRLRYFLTALDQGSMSRAALLLGVAQPGLSRQIQTLEQELKTSLLYRNGRGVTATSAGEEFAAFARPMVEGYDALKDRLLERAERPQGKVILGLPPTISRNIAAQVAVKFREQYPNASLQIREAFGSTLVEWVENGRIDAAVLCDARRALGRFVSPLLLEDLFLVQAAGRGNPGGIDLATLQELKFVLPGSVASLRHVIDTAARAAGIKLAVGIELDSMPAIKKVVEQGEWATILTYGAVHSEVKDGILEVTPLPIPMHALLVEVTAKNRAVDKTTTALLRIVSLEIRRCQTEGLLRGTFCSEGVTPQ